MVLCDFDSLDIIMKSGAQANSPRRVRIVLLLLPTFFFF